MFFKHFQTFAVLTAMAAGCGGGDEPGPGPDTEQRCDAFVSSLCYRVAKCTEDETRKPVPANFIGNCSDSWYSQRDCSDYPASPETHDSCVSQLHGFSCDVLVGGDSLSLPAACGKIIDAWPE